MKSVRYFLEALLLYVLFGFFGLLPIKTASALGGFLGRTIGPRLAASRKALRNIERALPSLKAEQQQQAIKDMWDNLGRIMAEYPHLEALGRNYTAIEGQEYFLNPRKQGRGVILFTAHIGNWEIQPPAILEQLHEEVDITYRAPNNPWSHKLIAKTRSLNGRLVAYSKSRSGGRGMLESMKQKRTLGILIDQKYNEGLAVPFFGIEAMTNPIFVQLAQKYNYALVPVYNQRVNDTNFKLVFEKEVPVFDEAGKALPIEDVIAKAHERLEHWITQKPGEWLWLHRRWDSERLRTN